MPIELDHTIVPSHHKVASAKLCFRVSQHEPDGHQWEMLTVSYARQPADAA